MKGIFLKDLKLIYFKMRALAETPQLLLHYAEIPYSYLMSWEFYKKPWGEVKSNVPFHQLPVLVVDNKNHIAQSGSIVRYIAKIANLVPKDCELAAEVDAVFETTQEMFSPLNPTVNFSIGTDFQQKRTTILESLPARLLTFERVLNKSSEGKFFFGNEPFYCDFAAYHHISLALFLDENLLKNYPKISEMMDAIESLPGIIKYLKTRPKLIGVGTCPQLVINGRAVSTGVSEV